MPRFVGFLPRHVAIAHRGARKLVGPETETSMATSAAYMTTDRPMINAASRGPLCDEHKELLAARLRPVSRPYTTSIVCAVARKLKM